MPVAIYIDPPHIAAAVVAGSAKRPRLKKVVVGDIAEARTEDGNVVVDRQKHLTDEIARFVKEQKLPGGKYYLLAGPEAMRYRELPLSFSDRRQIDKVIRFQVEGVIPSTPIEDLVVDYMVMSKTDDGSRVLVAAAEKEYLRKRLEALQGAGVAIEAIDCNLSGTLNLGLLHEELTKDKPPALWIDFAGTTSMVALVDGGEVSVARVFISPYLAGASSGTATADDAKRLAKRAAEDALDANRRFHDQPAERTSPENGGLAVDDSAFDEDEEEVYVYQDDAHVSAARLQEPEAEDEGEFPRLPDTDSAVLPGSDSVNLGSSEVADRIRHMGKGQRETFLKRVAVEVRRTLFMGQIHAKPARMVISGLGREGHAIAAELGRMLSIPEVFSVDLLEPAIDPRHFEEERKALPDIGALTYLVGTALKGLGRDHAGMNFRKGDLSPGTLFDYARVPLAFAATLMVLVSGVLLLLSYRQLQTVKQDIEYERSETFAKPPEVHWKAAFRNAPPAEDAEEKKARAYPADPEDPVGEIGAAHRKLSTYISKLKGETSTDHPIPHRADVVLSLVMKAIEDSKPSYEFALEKVDVSQKSSQGSVTIICYISTQETAEDLKAVDGISEGYRLVNALKEMTANHPTIFDGEPTQKRNEKGISEGGRSVNQIELTIPLRKVEKPTKKKSDKEAR